MTKEALKLALKALEDRTSLRKWQMARDAVKEALAQPERQWVGLTIEDKKEYVAQDFGGCRTDAMDWTEKRLMEKNT